MAARFSSTRSQQKDEARKQFKRRRKEGILRDGCDGGGASSTRVLVKMIEASNQVISAANRNSNSNNDINSNNKNSQKRQPAAAEQMRGGAKGRQEPAGNVAAWRGLSLVLINLICWLTLTSLPVALCSTLSDFDGATFYKATQGSRIRIACNASNWQDDSVSLILWFKGSMGPAREPAGSGGGRQLSAAPAGADNHNSQPIYTIDARQRSLTSGQARHLVADSYRGRARFVLPTGGPASANNHQRNQTTGVATYASPYLELASLEPDDQGEFRCRVDYRSRPRENFLMILFVLVPPSKVEIMDSNGRSLEQIYGPLNESSDLTLVCRSKGGRPPPALSWTSATGKVIDESYLTISDYLALQMSAGRRHSSPPTATRGPLMRAANLTEQEEKSLLLLSSSSPWSPSSWSEAATSDKNLGPTTTTTTATNVDGSGRPDESTIYTRHSSPEPTAGGPSISEGPEERAQWSLWAEMNYFGHLLAELAPAEEQQEEEPNRMVSNDNLLDFQVDETITTSVNVLHINELSRELVGSLAAAPNVAGSDEAPRLQHPKRLPGEPKEPSPPPRLQCRGSNLHYDLRALIKMFAPPSLVGPPPPPKGARRTSSGRRTATGRLAAAIETALEASMRIEQPLGQPHQQPGQTMSPTTNASRQLSQPLVSQIGADSSISGAISVAAATGLEPSAPPASGQSVASAADQDRWWWTTHEQRQMTTSAGWPNLIYQQLVRPHRLSSAGSGHEQAPLMVRSKLIALDAQLRPLDVKILGPQRPLAAGGQASEFGCVSSGSRPPARLTWLKNGRRLDPKLARQVHHQTTSDAGSSSATSTTSKLMIKLEREDHGAQLTCRAENPAKVAAGPAEGALNETGPPDGWTLEDSIMLSVQYPPKLKLELGNRMLSEHIREGTDIFFVCSVDAQPAANEITWLHDDRPLGDDPRQADAKRGPPAKLGATYGRQKSDEDKGQLIMSNNSLVLQRVRLEQRGKYTCMASNSEGVSVSNSIELRVLHAPVCVSHLSAPGDQNGHLVKSLALPLRAEASLDCDMSAEPVLGTHFTWYLNNSHNERRVIFESDVEPEASNRTSQLEQVARSKLRHWTIETSLDYGRLFCVASNSIGQQKRACVYQIEAPTLVETASSPGLNCLPVNVTSRSVWIGCHATTNANRISAESRDEPHGRLSTRFQVLLRLNDDEDDAKSSGPIKLTSDEFEDHHIHEQPNVFELTNLRPNSNYQAEISRLGWPLEQSNLVQFKTLDADAESKPQEENSGTQVAQIRTISTFNNSDLVASALQQISTRSANSRDLMGSSSASSNLIDSSSAHLGRQSKLWANSSSPTGGLWFSLGRLFGRNSDQELDWTDGPRAPLASRRLLKGHQLAAAPASTRLMDLASDSLLVGAMCLVLLVTLLTLLLVRRYAFGQSAGAAGSSSSTDTRYESSPIKLKAMNNANNNLQSSSCASNSGSSEDADYAGQDHQVADRSAGTAEPTHGTSTIRMHLSPHEPGVQLNQGQQQQQLDLTFGLRNQDMLATSSLQRRHHEPRPASVHLQRLAPNNKLLNNNNPKNVYEMPEMLGGSGQANVSRSRSSLSFGGSSTSMAGLGAQQQQAPLPPRLIHLSRQPLGGLANCSLAQQDQRSQVLISDANGSIFNQRPAMDEMIDLSLHQSHPLEAPTCWLSGPYIHLAGPSASALDEANSSTGTTATTPNSADNKHSYQLAMLSSAGRSRARAQQHDEQVVSNATSLLGGPLTGPNGTQVAGSTSDGSESNLLGPATCSCDEGQLSSSSATACNTRRGQSGQQADFILANNNEINRQYSAPSDKSSGHPTQVGLSNHHNYHHQHHLHVLQRQHLAYGQAQGDLIQLVAGLDRLDPNTTFTVFNGTINNNANKRRQNQAKRQAGQPNNQNNYHQLVHQQSLMSGSPSTGTNTTTTTTATANRLTGTSPLSMESSGATLSQDQPMDLLQQMAGRTDSCNDNESICDEHNSVNTNSNNQGQQQGQLASILKGSQRAHRTDLNSPDNLDFSNVLAPKAKLVEYPNECQCNSNNNSNSSTNL